MAAPVEGLNGTSPRTAMILEEQTTRGNSLV